jgi:toxin ParE1/3/4
MKVTLAREAEADLIEIGLFIAESNPLAAHRWVARLRARCRGLGRVPERCMVAFRTDPPIRRATEGAYNIFYTVGADIVMIRRILHGARNVDPAALGSS